MTAALLAPPRDVLYRHPDLGAIFVPRALERTLAPVSRPGAPTRRRSAGEFGVVVATQRRPVWDCAGDHAPDAPHGVRCWLRRMELIWHSISHNERVDVGAAIQANRCFGTAGSVANGVFTAIALASAVLTKTKTDLSLGSASSGATTNEFTTIGLSRAVGTLGAYTAPASLGGQLTQLLAKTFAATGTGTVDGAGVFDSTTPAASNLYVEDNFTTPSGVINGDTLAVQWSFLN